MRPPPVPSLLSLVALCAAVALALWGWIAKEPPVADAHKAETALAVAPSDAPPDEVQAVLKAPSVSRIGPAASVTPIAEALHGGDVSPRVPHGEADEPIDSTPRSGRSQSVVLNVDALKAGDEVAKALYNGFLAKVEKAGSIPLIIGLASPVAPESSLVGPGDFSQQRRIITAIQNVLLADLAGVGAEGVKRFETIPYLALTVDAPGLAELLRSNPVITIEEDVAVPPALLDSVPLIEADTLHTGRINGTGVTVAILDTGVDKSHPFLDGGKVVSEACYSTTYAAEKATSVCPSGVAESTAAGSGVACDYPGCDHGTWVAGIAAGKDGTGATGGTLQGTAPDANLIAIQVFSKFDDPIECDPDHTCVQTYISDQIKGLERVYTLRDSYTIAAVNLSVGGGEYTSICDAESARTASIEKLRAVGIATVIASGNSGLDGATNRPGCISSAITVGASDKEDALWEFSDHASWVDLIAPGVAIQSSVLNDAYEAGSGTSAAAPHISGCFALFRHEHPSASVTTIEAALKSSATVSVSRGGISKPRVDCYAAVMAPGATTLISPKGGTRDATPTYSWNALPTATSYHLWVNRGSSEVRRTWYTAAQAGCTAGTGTCSITPGAVLPAGAYTWRIQARTAQGLGPWSVGLDFAVESPPGAATPIFPQGLTGDAMPTYSWTATAAATSYKLRITRGADPVTAIWYTAEQAGCTAGTGTCSVTPKGILPRSAHTWQIQTRNRNGLGPWSARTLFTVGGPPSAPTAISPQGQTTDVTPTYRWTAVPYATSYEGGLLLADEAGGFYLTASYTAAEAGCAAGTGICSVTPSAVLPPGNNHFWSVRAKNSLGYGPSSNGLLFALYISPGSALPISPVGETTDTSPTYSWNAIATAASYKLRVVRSSGEILAISYTAAEAGCAAGTATCSVTPSTVLQNGFHTWWVQATTSQGLGPWSARTDFAIGAAGLPGGATPVSPEGMTIDTPLTYRWNAVATAASYKLRVVSESGEVMATWYTAAQAGCAGGTGVCSITPSTAVPRGARAWWWIQTRNPYGSGPWSDRMYITVSAEERP